MENNNIRLDNDPHKVGKWEKAFESRVVGIHTSLLHNGKVLFFTYPSKENHHHNHANNNNVHSHGSAERTGDSEVLDPITKESKKIALERNIFCGGACFLEDGNLFVAGGQYQTIYSFWDPPSRDIHNFNTAEERWIRLRDKEKNKFMEMKARWYPTCLTLADGKVLIISGRYSFYAINFWIFRFVNNTLQFFDPKGSLQAPQKLPFEIALYPFMHLLPSGKVFVHSGTISRLYNLSTNMWDTVKQPKENRSAEKQQQIVEYKTQYEFSRTNPGQGTSVMLPLFPTPDPPYRARIMIIGGAGSDNPVIQTPATEKAEIIDFGELNPRWKFTQSMNNQRVMPDAIILPNAKILVVNGSSKGKSDTAVDPVLDAELFDPELEIWEIMSPMTVPRLYHAAAILLPDGRVLVSGTDGEWNKPPYNKDQRNIEIFDPPYLFHQQRPKIMAVPSNLTYNTLFDIETPIPDNIASVALIRSSSVTHSLNTDQRYVGLEIVSSSYNKLKLKSPPDGKIAPPGYYMLFVLDRNETPSIAKFVHIS
jgi:hypothetical protein